MLQSHFKKLVTAYGQLLDPSGRPQVIVGRIDLEGNIRKATFTEILNKAV